MSNIADSAGVPWQGRDLKPNPFSGDTGEADPKLRAALAAAAANPHDPNAHVTVIDALKGTRVYAPVLPTAIEHTTDEAGLVHDNKSEMAMVRLAASDGRECTPCFTDIPTLTAWHPQARPVPIEAERLCAAAVEEGAQLVIVDPGAPHSFLIRRPALWNFLQQFPWAPAWADGRVANAVAEVAAEFEWVAKIGLGAGDTVLTSGPEVRLVVHVEGEPAADDLGAFQAAIGERAVIIEQVDSLSVSFVRA